MMERRLFLQALAASVVAAGAALPVGFPAHADGLEIIWHKSSGWGPFDPLADITTCGWKAWVGGKKYGDFIVVDEQALREAGPGYFEAKVRELAAYQIQKL